MENESQTARIMQISHELTAITEQVTAAMLHSVTDENINHLRFPQAMEALFQQFFDIKARAWHKQLGQVVIILFSIWFVVSLFFPAVGIVSKYTRDNALVTFFIVVITYTNSTYILNKMSFWTYQRVLSIFVMQLILYITWLRIGYGLLFPAFLSLFIGRLLLVILLRMRFWDGTIFSLFFLLFFYALVWIQSGNIQVETFSASIIVTSTTLGILYILEHELRREFLHVAMIHHLAIHDSLTGVFNRRHFMNQLDKEVALAKRYRLPLTMLMIDIDSFKEVNDCYGHASGDEALRRISQCCMQELRVVDCFGRIGGEEFAVLLPNTNIQGALDLAERLRSKVAAILIKSNEHQFSCTLSLGVTQLKHSDKAPTDLLDRADEGLYRAKHQGKNRVISVE